MDQHNRCKRPAKIVIVGAGFGGFQAAQSLAGAAAEVLLIDRHDYHTFTPLLYQVATGQIEPALVTYPVRTKLRPLANVTFLQATVESVDMDHRLIASDDGLIPYDYLVLATGTRPSYHGIPGAREYAFGLKSLADAIALRHHLHQCYRQAWLTEASHQRQRLLTFVVVGGGATGVELAGALAEQMGGPWPRAFPDLAQLGQILLIQSGPRLLPEFSRSLGDYAHDRLHGLAVEVWLNTRVVSVDATGVQLSDGSFLETATVIWAAGLEAAQPTYWPSPALGGNGKLRVCPTLQLLDYPNVYGIGDVATIDHPRYSLAGVAPEALQQGVTVARSLRRQLSHRPPHRFRYRSKGRLAIIGGGSGIGRIAGVDIRGFGTWLLWLLVHLIYLPGYRNRSRLLRRWWRNYLLCHCSRRRQPRPQRINPCLASSRRSL
ncbi:NADH dehydrogenase family protein [Halomicronema hongdechloris C2206]|uniref:NADH:ubiquinone reductase (non-electrogenic) n=1 Tax=Halomicronema hongdechloris C2206 TaxID=1641165 RepID=A0A1Z3HTG2_9CYAN|nr:NAD(P)/FAD-dependent oxidoreductase [Halomicronema hongdechloris]ASC73556.1 NADH dehydrogenase family protein [Halomicronema hongdechloris C2206]